ncbi:MAG: PKD domain-containing protein [Crocinitomicaceae bacterium]
MSLSKGDIVWSFITVVLLMIVSQNAFAQEICDNAIDDDGDGLIDLNDDECNCTFNIDLSLIPNPSFEDTLCCPTSEGLVSCATDWFQASDATSDFYHSCGLTAFDIDGAIPPATPIPGGGDGYIGLFNFGAGYREYVGACLTTPMLAGVTYTLEFYTAYSFGELTSADIEIYGSPSCVDLPWAGVNCPDGVGLWELLATKTVFYELDGSWQLISVEITPVVNMNAISFGATCDEVGIGEGSYFYYDELVLIDTETGGFIESTGGWCSDDLVLEGIFEVEGGTYQWYLNGVALIGETVSILEPIPYGFGEFTVVYSFPGGCQRVSYNSPSIPTTDFSFENVCLGTPVIFTNNSLYSTESLGIWEWVLGDGTTANTQDVDHFYPIPGNYAVQLIAFSDDPSCNDTAFANVSVGATPSVDFEITGTSLAIEGGSWVSCANDYLFFTDLSSIDEPVSFASWSWYWDDSLFSTEENPELILNNGGSASIKLVVLMENGCVDSIEQSLNLIEVNANYLALDSICAGESISFLDLSSVSDGSPIVSWRWDMDDDSDTIYDQNPTYLFSEGAIYNVLLCVENDRGCKDSIAQNVTVFPNPTPNFYANQDPTDYFNTDLRLIMIYPDEQSTYEWYMPGGAPDFSTEYGSTNVKYPEFVTGEYEVLLIEETVNGCVDSVWHTIEVLEDEMIFAPNALTLNNDGINETWGVYTKGYRLDEYILQLYNRWGELIWESRNPDDRWDGTYPNGGKVSTGTYVWYIKARDQINDEVFEYYGHLTVFH